MHREADPVSTSLPLAWEFIVFAVRLYHRLKDGIPLLTFLINTPTRYHQHTERSVHLWVWRVTAVQAGAKGRGRDDKQSKYEPLTPEPQFGN